MPWREFHLIILINSVSHHTNGGELKLQNNTFNDLLEKLFRKIRDLKISSITGTLEYRETRNEILGHEKTKRKKEKIKTLKSLAYQLLAHCHMQVTGLMGSHDASSWTPVTGSANWHVHWQWVSITASVHVPTSITFR